MKNILAVLILAVAGAAGAQTIAQNPLWAQPADPLRVIGDVYYVGSEGLSSWLIRTKAGDILIDGGMDYTAPQIEANLTKIGVKLSEVKILLNSHAHLDHAGGFAQLKKDTGAKLIASMADKPLLEAGLYPGLEDDKSTGFPPVKVDKVFADGDTVSLGGVTLTAHITPGHTPGCTTWTLPVVEDGRSHEIIFFCSASVAYNKLVGKPTYPGIVDDYRRTFAEAPKIKGDVFLAPHAEQFGFVQKRAALLANRAKGSKENPFVGEGEFKAALTRLQADFETQLAAQTKALAPAWPTIAYSSQADAAAAAAKVKSAGAALAVETLVSVPSRRAVIEFRSEPTPPLIHDQGDEFISVVDGSGTMIVGGVLRNEKRRNAADREGTGIDGGVSYPLEKGAYLFIPAGVAHYFASIGKEGLTIVSMKAPLEKN